MLNHIKFWDAWRHFYHLIRFRMRRMIYLKDMHILPSHHFQCFQFSRLKIEPNEAIDRSEWGALSHILCIILVLLINNTWVGGVDRQMHWHQTHKCRQQTLPQMKTKKRERICLDIHNKYNKQYNIECNNDNIICINLTDLHSPKHIC